MVEARQAVPCAVVARQQKPRLVPLVVQDVLKLKRLRADVLKLAAAERARDAAERFRTRRKRVAHLLHAPALDERRQKRSRLTLITVDCRPIRAQRVDDDEDDVLAVCAGYGLRVRG